MQEGFLREELEFFKLACFLIGCQIEESSVHLTLGNFCLSFSFGTLPILTVGRKRNVNRGEKSAETRIEETVYSHVGYAKFKAQGEARYITSKRNIIAHEHFEYSLSRLGFS